jgi:hypothetical protein
VTRFATFDDVVEEKSSTDDLPVNAVQDELLRQRANLGDNAMVTRARPT